MNIYKSLKLRYNMKSKNIKHILRIRKFRFFIKKNKIKIVSKILNSYSSSIKVLYNIKPSLIRKVFSKEIVLNCLDFQRYSIFMSKNKNKNTNVFGDNGFYLYTVQPATVEYSKETGLVIREEQENCNYIDLMKKYRKVFPLFK